MAVQTKVVRLIMAGAVAIALSGCVSVPDAIKGSSPTPAGSGSGDECT